MKTNLDEDDHVVMQPRCVLRFQDRRRRDAMTPDEYTDWWIKHSDDDNLPEPIATLAAHVMALQDRIDGLPEHDSGCLEHDHRCCCAYDHPGDICQPHARRLT
jgi:hypothetical protein